jgi:hypothetical protein
MYSLMKAQRMLAMKFWIEYEENNLHSATQVIWTKMPAKKVWQSTNYPVKGL